MKQIHRIIAIILVLISMYSCSKGGNDINEVEEVKQNSYTLTFFAGGDNHDKLCVEITNAEGSKSLDLKVEGEFDYYYRYLDPKWDAYYGEQTTYRKFLERELATKGAVIEIADIPSIDFSKEVITRTAIDLTLGFYLTKKQAFEDTLTYNLTGSLGDPVPCAITYKVKKDDPVLSKEFFTVNGEKIE